ncbi:MAG: Ig-like domain repeat protein [Fimbriimonadales bacterium]|nr:Ig-like domain repeat protein [Fimbriimonadales bacterium]
MRTILKVLGLLAVVSIIACGGGGGGGGAPNPPLGADTTPPAVGAISVQPALLSAGVEATVSAPVTDDRSGVASVQAVLTYPDNSQVSVTLSFVQGVYRGSWQAHWNGAAGRVRIQIRAVDQAGNQASREMEVNAAGAPPPPPF